MRLLCVALALLIPGAAAAQQTDCTGQPIPMQGTYTYNGGSAEITYDSDVAAECPSTFYLSVNSGPLVGLEVRYGALGDLSHGIVVSTNTFAAVHLDIAPRFNADDLYLGGIRTYDTFSLVAELASLEFDISEHGIGYFTLQEGVAPRCICEEIETGIAASEELIGLYRDQRIIDAAIAYNLMSNFQFSYYLRGDDIIINPEDAREVEGHPGLTYQQLIAGIYNETLEVVGDGRTVPFEIRLTENQTGETLNVTVETDEDGDGVTDGAAAELVLNNCTINMPDPRVATQQCTTGIELFAAWSHENTHVQQCLGESYRDEEGQFTIGGSLRGPYLPDGTLLRPDQPEEFEFDELPTGGLYSQWPSRFPGGFPTQLTGDRSISMLRNAYPGTQAQNEVEAHSVDLAIQVEFRDTYCGGEAGRGDPADDGLFFAEDTVDPETGLPIENPDATK